MDFGFVVDEGSFYGIFGPNQTAQNLNNKPENTEDDPDYKVFQNRGLPFVHINANSILSKIGEVKIIASKTKAAVIGISESKLDETALNGEINVHGYNILRSDRNKHG